MEPIVKVKNGYLKGKTAFDLNNKIYYSFQGIPYAKPPIGILRFKAPQPADDWDNIRDATVEGEPCFSHPFNSLESTYGAENCLVLNVYTPEVNQPSHFPVMFFIHGGAFTAGSGTSAIFGPDYLVSENVILVTINYRLGYLGFLCLHDTSLEVPGNAGIKDCLLALKWVQENITAFGGDPSNVTLFGQSAGAAISHYILLSPHSKGLFHKIILQSGTVLNHWAVTKNTTYDLGKTLGLEWSNDEELLKLLQEVPVEKILKGQDALLQRYFPAIKLFRGPIIEQPSETACVTENPINVIRSDKYPSIPMIIGYNNQEGLFFEGESKHFKSFEYVIPYYFNIKPGSKESIRLSKQIKEFYFKDKDITEETINQYYQMRGDISAKAEIHKAITEHTKTNACPIFMYTFSADTDLNLFKPTIPNPPEGATHTDEIGYLFKTFASPDLEPGSREYLVVKRIVRLWTNFAKYGNPTPLPNDELLNVCWNAVDKENLYYLNIGNNLSLDRNPDKTSIHFLDKILYSKL